MTLGAVVWISPPDMDVAQQPLLGASVAMRSAAVALSLPRELHVLFAAPPGLHATLSSEAARFGLSEVDTPVEAASVADAVRVALDRWADVEVILVLDGTQPVVTAATARALVDACRPGAAACGCQPLSGPVYRGGDGLQDQVDGPLWQLGLPVAAVRADWAALPAGWPGHPAAALMEAGHKVVPVALDADALPVRSTADLSRAVEAFGRRAPQLPLLWPRVMGTPTGAVTAPPAGRSPNITLVDTPGDG